MIMLHIKQEGMKRVTTYKQKFCLDMHLRDPLVGSKGQTAFFLKVVMLHIK